MTVGLVFFDDLFVHAPWFEMRSDAWLTHAAEDRRAPSLLPPAALVVVVRGEFLHRIEERLGWLRAAQRVVLVVETAGDDQSDAEDPELSELIANERAALIAALGNVRAVLERPRADAATLDEARAAIQGEAPWPVWKPSAVRPAVAPGEWIAWDPVRWTTTSPIELADCIRQLAAQLCWVGDRPTLLELHVGRRLDLLDGTTTRFHEPVPSVTSAAAWPDGASWWQRVPSPENPRSVRFQRKGVQTWPSAHGPYSVPIAVDPSGQVAWAGNRCYFHWFPVTEEGPVCWIPSSHGWPVGHGKKLYGYENNDPLFVHIAPDASACLSVYEHDVLLTPGIPMRWRDANGMAVAERVYEPRALFYQRTDDPAAFPGDPAQGDEDARDRYATVTLGPSDAMRYVVGFDAPTWRMTGDLGLRLGGPELSWAVYDASHREVWRGDGRLLAGWNRWIVVECDGALVRYDVALRTAEALGSSGRAIDAAVAIPGSPNVVLIALGEAPTVRVV